MPSRSVTPGRKDSTSTSACAASCTKRARSPASFRSKTALRLLDSKKRAAVAFEPVSDDRDALCAVEGDVNQLRQLVLNLATNAFEALAESHPRQIEVVEGIGFSHYIRNECPQAIPHFERSLELRAADPSILNATGDCYQRVGLPQKALSMFRLSLQAKPDQAAVRQRINDLENNR